MGTKALKKRDIWQNSSGKKAEQAEHNFCDVFLKEFEDTDFTIRANPKEFKHIYVDIELSEKVLAEIYTPDIEIKKHGLAPDYAIDNKKTKKSLYVEVKRQDGWVEGKPRSAGRGNAHERSCKYFTPGLLKILRENGKLGDDILPFWTVFQGDITRDPCRVREITCWFAEHSAHFFMWRNSADSTELIAHFNKRLKYLLA